MPGAETFRASAAAYDRLVGRYGPQLAAAMLDFARVEEGMRALDVGCGPGALTRALAQRLGPSAVSAADPSAPFADACRERVPGAGVVVAGAEQLPFADDAFDAVLSQLVVNFMSDAHAGVREMARVARAGAVLAACVWDYAGEMTLLRAFWDAAREVDPERGAAADEGIVMRWCREGELAGLWRDCGQRDVRLEALTVSASYDSFEDLWAPLPTGVAPSGAFCASLDPERRAALREAFRLRLGAGDEPFELTARAWAVAGTVGRLKTPDAPAGAVRGCAAGAPGKAAACPDRPSPAASCRRSRSPQARCCSPSAAGSRGRRGQSERTSRSATPTPPASARRPTRAVARACAAASPGSTVSAAA